MSRTIEQPQVMDCPGCGEPVLHVQLAGSRGLLVSRREVPNDAPPAVDPEAVYVAVSEAGDARPISTPEDRRSGEAVHVPHLSCRVLV